MTGFICIDKRAGASSAKEVNTVKKLVGTPCGHMGTLDPMATGVLPVAIGNAARLFDYFLDKRKTYIATFRFGLESDTLDTTGNVREGAGFVPERQQIEEVLPKFIGEIMQVPPRFSAKNIAGTRGYTLARQGIDFELAPKKVNIYSVRLLEKVGVDGYSFSIECGGGTYIRSIARDLAETLGTCAVMSALVRTKSGIFTIENSVRTDCLTVENIKNFIIPTESVLPYESIYLDEKKAKKLLNGVPAPCGLADGIYKIFNTDKSFYGLAEVNQSVLMVRKKLC